MGLMVSVWLLVEGGDVDGDSVGEMRGRGSGCDIGVSATPSNDGPMLVAFEGGNV